MSIRELLQLVDFTEQIEVFAFIDDGDIPHRHILSTIDVNIQLLDMKVTKWKPLDYNALEIHCVTPTS